MNELNNLTCFLNSIKETLPFDDENDFTKKLKKVKSSESKSRNWFIYQNILDGTILIISIFTKDNPTL